MPPGSPRSLMPLAPLALVVLACGGTSGTTHQVTAIGGGWYVDHMIVSGSEPTHVKDNLLRVLGKDTALVDEWLDRHQFYPPDCVVYSAGGRRAGWFAVCGDRTPVPLPGWVLEARDDGVWGGYVARDSVGLTVERWEMSPIDSIRDLALKQGKRRKQWASRPEASRPAKVTKVFVDSPPKP